MMPQVERNSGTLYWNRRTKLAQYQQVEVLLLVCAWKRDTELGVVELVERALKRTMSSETSKLESSLTFLATTGSAAPFIGLFGTVWGIMTSFIGLASSQGVPTLQAVAPGIAEALVATAVGLAAAIPAVIGYNYSLSRVKKIDIDMENFSSEFLNIVDRYVKKV